MISMLDLPVDISGSTIEYPTLSKGTNRWAFVTILMRNGGGTARQPSSLSIGGVSATFIAGESGETNRVCSATWGINESGITSMSDNSVTMTGQSGTIRTVIAYSIHGGDQSSPVNTNNLFVASGAGSLTLLRAADSLTIFNAYCTTLTPLVLTDPAENIIFHDSGNATTLSMGYAQDTARTADATFSSTGTQKSAHIINFPPAASEPDPDPVPEIDPTGTDTTLANGSSQQISFTGLTATPTSVSLVHGGNVFAQPNFSVGAVTEGVATANFTAAIGNLPYTSAAYPASGFSYLVMNDNGTELTLSGITINPSSDRSVVTAVNPVNDSTSIIPSWLEGGAVTGDQIDWPKVVGNIQPTVNPDFTHRGDRIDKNIPWPDSIKFTVNYWDSVTSIRYAVTVEVAYAEDGTGTVIGITTRELTTRSLTVRNLTMRSL